MNICGGHDEGRKDRPAVIALTVRRERANATIVTVLPVTHTAPSNPDAAIEIPAPVKRHLGLDKARSWIVVAEGNEFEWPGYDLRRIGKAERYDYGFLPPLFFNQVIAAFVAWRRVGAGRITPRI